MLWGLFVKWDVKFGVKVVFDFILVDVLVFNLVCNVICYNQEDGVIKVYLDYKGFIICNIGVVFIIFIWDFFKCFCKNQ